MANIKNPVTIVFAGGGSSGDAGLTLLRSVVNKTVTAITAEDLGSITSIGTYAFYGCSSLTSATIPATVTSLGLSCFQEDGFLETVIFQSPSALTTFANRVFYFCVRLKSIVIPSGVTSIGNHVFDHCDRLKKVVMLPSNPPTLNNSDSFSNTTCLIYASSPSTYRGATNWAAVKDGNNESRIFPLVATVADLANVDTTTYTKACVTGADYSYKQYTYDGSAWNEVDETT